MSTHRLSLGQPNDVLKEYFLHERIIKKAFEKVDITMYPSGVCSEFGGSIKTVPEIAFIYHPISFEIPNEIISVLQSFAVHLGVKSRPFCNQKLFFGYSGRYYDRGTQAKLITDGLQVSGNNWIITDLFTYMHASRDCFHHRLIHELLHVLGVEEKDMSSMIYLSCLATYDISAKFEEEVLSDVSRIYDGFCKSLRKLIRANTATVNRIITLADMLTDYGFPDGISTSLYTATYMPSKLLPELEITGYEVLFL